VHLNRGPFKSAALHDEHPAPTWLREPPVNGRCRYNIFTCRIAHDTAVPGVIVTLRRRRGIGNCSCVGVPTARGAYYKNRCATYRLFAAGVVPCVVYAPDMGLRGLTFVRDQLRPVYFLIAKMTRSHSRWRMREYSRAVGRRERPAARPAKDTPDAGDLTRDACASGGRQHRRGLRCRETAWPRLRG
jgi:hypothetical protein